MKSDSEIRKNEGPRILVVAGEASGDLHGGELVREIRKRYGGAEIYGIGGDELAAAGVDILRHAREMAFLGFFEVVRHLPFILKVLKEIKSIMDRRRPDLVLLVDYPGFNMRVAREARKRSIPVCYYISPQVWAWGQHRIPRLARLVDRMLVVFPFEATLYDTVGLDVRFVGHPLKDTVRVREPRETFLKSRGLDPGKPVLALLPGSRKQEVAALLPEMIQAVRRLRRSHPGLQAVLGMAPMLDEAFYEPFLNQAADVHTVRGDTYGVMAHADAALVASGTATLETAILGTPLAVLYKMSWLSYTLGRILVKVKHVGLVNIVAGREIVPELLQDQATSRRMAAFVDRVLTDREYRNRMCTALSRVSDLLGEKGASFRAAEAVLSFWKETSAPPAGKREKQILENHGRSA